MCGLFEGGERVEDERRIGVYICWCGGNISDVVDVKKVVESVKDEPGVVVAKDFMFMCSDAGQKMIEDDIKEHELNAIVVASCSPKLHEITFRNVLKRAGVNPYMYYHANIREHASWAHSDDPEEATRKAIRHVRAAIAYVRRAQPLEKIKVSSQPSALIIGGGISGLRAALDLSRMGINVFIVEKQPYLGGRVAQLGEVYPYGRKGYEIISDLIAEVKKRENIVVYTNAEVEEIKGFVGNFDVTISVKPRYFKGSQDGIEEAVKVCPVEVPDEFNFGLTKRKAIILPPYPGAYPETPAIDMENCTRCGECSKHCEGIDLNQEEQRIGLKVGSIIVTTGFDPYEPKEGEYGYKKFSNVVTLPQFIRYLQLSSGKDKLVFNGKEVGSIAFIYCVGSRQRGGDEEKVNEYCSRYCCNAVMYITLTLLDKYRDLRVYHLCRDVRTYGKNELMYEEASKRDVKFIKYDENDPPKVVAEGDGVLVKTKDLLTEGIELEIPVDLVVLVTGMIPRNNEKLNAILKLPIGRDGFYQEVHPKLRPVETTLDGILIAGTCQGPKDIKETLLSTSAAAAKAAGLLMKGYLELEPFVAFVDTDKCNACEKCVSECLYGAVEMKEYEKLGKKAWVNEALCKGCGACVAICPTGAIQLRGLTNEQVEEMIKASAKEA